MARHLSRLLVHTLVCAASLAGLAGQALADDAIAPKPATKKEAKAAVPNNDPVAVAAALKRTDSTEVKTMAGIEIGNEGTALDVPASGGEEQRATAGGLARVHGTTTRQADVVAGAARDVHMNETHAARTPKPQASPRQMRRMNAERVAASLSPAFQSCVDAAPGKQPSSTTAVLAASVGASGTVESTEVVNAGGLSPDVLVCLQQQVRSAKFGAPGGVGAIVAIPASVTSRAK